MHCCDGTDQILVLELGPTNAQLTWFLVPSVLFIIIMALLGYRIVHRDLGGIDFTDPTQVLIASLVSPQSGDWANCSTGKFADSEEYAHRRVYFGVADGDQTRVGVYTSPAGRHQPVRNQLLS